MFLEVLSVELFYFTPFKRKQLQIASETAGEALINK
jgi:hypothetical protein